MKVYYIPSRIYLLVVLIFYFSFNCHSQSLSADKIFKKFSSAVVIIKGYDKHNNLIKQGSGVILRSKGNIITNYHVVVGCDKIEILQNDKKIPYLDIAGVDVDLDILLFKIGNIKAPNLVVGNSNSLLVGQKIYAIGSPLGLENSMSEGIISGIRNTDDNKKLIQITASISPGSSGGALLNENGALIGISSSSIEKGQNINFAIPIDEILKIEKISKLEDYKDYELLYKGNEALREGRSNEAIDFYKEFLTKFPDNSNVCNIVAIISLSINDYSNALKYFTKVIEIEQSNTNKSKSILFYDTYINIATLKYSMGKYYESMEWFDKALEIGSNPSSVYDTRGWVKMQLGKYYESIQDFDTSIEYDPQQDNAYFNRAGAKTFLKDYLGALKDLNKAIEINPSKSEYYKIRGINKIMLGDKYAGCSDLSKAAELGDESVYNLMKQFCN